MSEHASQLDSFFSSIIKLMSGRASFLLPLVYLLAFPHVSLAQVLYGSLTGTVTDPSSAVVSGAKVRSGEIRTGVTQETTTDGNGIYRFITLLSGKYKVTITAPGFTTQETSEVRIVANQVARVNAVLSVATASQNVIVTAEAPLLNLDMSVTRNFKITERFTFQFEADAFGVTNTPHFNNPTNNGANADISRANFGAVTSTLVTTNASLGGSGGQRQWWFGGKLIF